METYCTKCKRKTLSLVDSDEVVQTENKKWRVKNTCALCGSEKSTFIKMKPSAEDRSREYTEAKELHRAVIKKFPKRKIVTTCIDDLWAADLVIMDRYVKENDGYRYMLNVIDTFSKYAWSEPLTRKSGQHVADAFETIIRRAEKTGHNAPNLLHVDKGREFVNKDFKQLLETYGIKMYHTENEEKSAIVERFNRTLNERMKVQFEMRHTFRWIDTVQDLLRQYNTAVHRTIRMRPSDVDKSCEPRLQNLYESMQPTTTVRKAKLSVGDRVRIVAKKDTFANKYSRNWNREIFVVSKLLNTAPITYRIKDSDGEEILGSFYERELQKTVF